MATKREAQICLEATPFYHCYVRCVRRAYLCGNDSVTGDNYDHRKQWIVSRLKFLSYVYAIDICAYAVMSNHYHVVLHVEKARALAWSQEEVVERWMQVCSGNMLVDRWLEEPDALDEAALEVVYETIEEWRSRLHSISWFMRCVNETIARMANEEEACKGRFWEGRFKSQALLDEVALLSCMAYVDLNPVRAAMEEDLIDSDFTSIQQRLFDYAKHKTNKTTTEKRLVTRVNKQRRIKELLNLKDLPEASLMPFSASNYAPLENALPFTREDYFDLVDSTGKLIRSDKKGFLDEDAPPLLRSLGINPNHWLEHVKFFNLNYSFCVGRIERMRDFVAIADRSLGKGSEASRHLYQ
ncbi:MAG: transposase [Cellvibrionaceae bacterium]|nr:transposase [Cellvibrionaceae bacterium]